ncbi:unnamed protein product [Gongylonema pulchrum]|uniref:Secreted protein n=1 Tax=Gongylonema pulchrum TaxID=637853 RepID=A0A183E2I4_9BILA|nr:unnamed protein product [Gongylonema pulchrum]
MTGAAGAIGVGAAGTAGSFVVVALVVVIAMSYRHQHLHRHHHRTEGILLSTQSSTPRPVLLLRPAIPHPVARPHLPPQPSFRYIICSVIIFIVLV